MNARILRLVLVLSLLLPGISTADAKTDPVDPPYPLYFPLVYAGDQACQILYQDPFDNATIPKFVSFVARWDIQNTSQSTWKASSVTIRFISGDRLHSGVDVKDMPYNVAPGTILSFAIMMTTPTTPGTYVSNWALVEGNTFLCTFYVKIRVI
jgi:hypothetical protein